MANDDLSREFQRMNEPVSHYWRSVKVALDPPLPLEEILRDGFWPRTKFFPLRANRFQEDRMLREEFAAIISYIRHRGDRPAESF